MTFHSVTFNGLGRRITKWFPSRVAAVWFIEAAELHPDFELKKHTLPGGLLNKQAVCEILEDWTSKAHPQ